MSTCTYSPSRVSLYTPISWSLLPSVSSLHVKNSAPGSVNEEMEIF